MNEEELTDALRRTLQARASAITPSPGTRPTLAPAASRWAWLPTRNFAYAGIAAAVVAAAAITAVVTNVSAHPGRGSSIAVTGEPTTPPSSNPAVSVSPSTAPHQTTPPTSAVTATSLPATGVASGFQPISVSFVSQNTGWVLGTVHCDADLCAAVARTTDAGHSWSMEPGPPITFPGQTGYDPSANTIMRFANPSDGWIVSPIAPQSSCCGSSLWSTHDGGRTWASEVPPGATATAGTIMALEASGGYVYAVVNESPGDHIFFTAVSSDRWTQSPETLNSGAGPVPTSQLVLQGNSGWLLNVDRTVVGGALLKDAAAQLWTSWTPPCQGANGPAFLAAGSPSDVTAICGEGQSGNPSQLPPGATAPSYWLYGSSDRGLSFAPVHQVPYTNISAMSVAPSGSATIVAAADPGLVASFDGGTTWQTVHTISMPRELDYVGFTTAMQGVAIEGHWATGSSNLLMTRDGGHSWRAVQF